MLAASTRGPRLAVLQTCCLGGITARGYNNNSRGGVDRPLARQKQEAGRKNGEQRRDTAEARTSETHEKKQDAPSLYEKLFPEHRAIKPEGQPPLLEPIPPLTASAISTRSDNAAGQIEQRKAREEARKLHWSQPKQLLRNNMHNQSTETSVLVLRNVSKNLVPEDFTRLIPKGRHMESWTMDQGDILSIVPMRDLVTLEQLGSYYLLFANALSAFTYQGYATRIHRMVAAHTPSSLLSPIAPPPGYLIDGVDAHAAIDSFTLVPPTQAVDLRQLNPPLTPLVSEIVENGGYTALHQRKDRMPFEARITTEGPQLSLHSLRQAFVESARSRGLNWSGGKSKAPRLSLWEPPKQRTAARSRVAEVDVASDGHDTPRDIARRRPLMVYIAGFRTKRALQSFIFHWHRRPLETAEDQVSGEEDYESPPIANVEVLW